MWKFMNKHSILWVVVAFTGYYFWIGDMVSVFGYIFFLVGGIVTAMQHDHLDEIKELERKHKQKEFDWLKSIVADKEDEE